MHSKPVQTIVVPASAQLKRNCQASVIGLNDGGLLLAYSQYLEGSAADQGPANIVALRSTDGGRSWGSPCTIAGSRDQTENVQSVSLVHLGAGKIGAFYTRIKPRMGPGWARGNYQDRDGVRRTDLMMNVTLDEGLTWSEGRSINPPDEFHQCIVNDAAQRLSSGRVIMPCDQITSNYSAGAIAFLRPIFSDDEGRTWRQSRYRVLLKEAGSMGEPSLTQMSDGRLIMITRSSRAGFVYKCYSEDGGDTWTLPETTDLVTSPSPGQVRRVPGTDDLLVVWNQVTKKEWVYGFARHRLSCAISSDGGNTWKHHKNLESFDDRTYIPAEEAGIRLPSGEIGGPTGAAAEVAKPRMAVDDRKAAMGFVKEKNVMAEYPSAIFVGETAFISYDLATPAGLALKLQILPKEWFYDNA